ncbi:MAG: S8 family serine peptidase [bacterium]
MRLKLIKAISIVMRTLEQASPAVGVLLVLGLFIPAYALDTPREIILELDRTVQLQQKANQTTTDLLDLNALLQSFPVMETRYAVNLQGDRHPQLKRFLLVRLQNGPESQVSVLLEQARRLRFVRTAQPNRLLRAQYIPNDPFFNQQWGLERIGAVTAWDKTSGSAAAPIAIIDTGCEMDHPDLIGSFWVNSDEIPDNGVDDDGNGYVDDLNGWDFVDAPSFPAAGDYLDRDHDPSDEMGHGTAVAGICGAAINNSIGIAGLAPECPLMILRAGNSEGYLQEDDVAAAILYALDNGAKVANLSFGDTQASSLLETVVQYASNEGLLLVAAAGNYANSNLVYPAAFGFTLSVGACDENNGRAPFSSYGATLDLLAPGSGIVSTILEGSYGAFLGGNGTSYAAPFVSAAAGLLFTLHPTWDAATVKSVLKSSADDIGSVGWDLETGQGILRVDQALEVTEALTVEIESPITGQGYVSVDTLDVFGAVAGVYLKNYQIFTGVGTNPLSWELIVEYNGYQVVHSLLARWRNSEPLDTAYTIRLVASDIFGNQVDERVVIYIDPSAPVVSDVSLVPIYEEDHLYSLLSFKTDDLTTGKVWLQAETGANRLNSLALNYLAAEHVLLLGPNLLPREYDVYIQVENASGLTDSTESQGSVEITDESITANTFVALPANGIPLGHLYEYSTDLDADGFQEVWVDSFDAAGSLSHLRIFEATSGWAFADQGLDFGVMIPKSIGDSDADGFSELLTLYAGKSQIVEATTTTGFPQPANVIWSDSGNVWGVKLMDLVSGDGHGEVLLIKDGMYKLYSHTNAGGLSFLQSLPNPFSPSLTSHPPFCRVQDFDLDGKMELLFGDYTGRLFIYERQTDGTLQVTWSDSLPLLDTGEFITEGDYDGDGFLEFAALAHTQTSLAGEHLADTRHWALFIYENSGDNLYDVTDTLYFFGAESPSSFASGVSSGDLIAGARPEILLCLYPDFYVVQWDSLSGDYLPIWYFPQCRSNKAVVGDYNRNGHAEFLFSSGSEIHLFEEVGSWSAWLPPPLGFNAVVKPDRVEFDWQAVVGVQTYNLYKGVNPDSLILLVELPATAHTYTDFNVIKDSTYYYAISSYALGLLEGPTTLPLTATPNDPPFVVGDTVYFQQPNFITVQFNEPMGLSLLDPNNFWLTQNIVKPSTILMDAGGSKGILSFDFSFNDTTYHLVMKNLYDAQGSLYTQFNDTLDFNVVLSPYAFPYLVNAHSSSDSKGIVLIFSEPMNATELSAESNYQITVDPATGISFPTAIGVASADPGDISSTMVQLSINPATPLGNCVYRIRAKNLHNNNGTPIDTLHNSATIDLSAIQTNLDEVYAYPNPYDESTGYGTITFDKLTPNAEIRILTLSGIVIRQLEGSGTVQWDLRNERGDLVGSGIYLYRVTGNGHDFLGKLAVVR